jgi:hypothetical protein
MRRRPRDPNIGERDTRIYPRIGLRRVPDAGSA